MLEGGAVAPPLESPVPAAPCSRRKCRFPVCNRSPQRNVSDRPFSPRRRVLRMSARQPSAKWTP
eukprot:11612906-Alexandrium_andersonii.AAC.1